MRIVQIIDSLEIGGAERMAVSYANALSEKISFSGLVATRAEGLLKHNLEKKVSYLFLKKKSILDYSAITTLFKYCKGNKVGILHAHSTSVFTAVLIKILLPNIKVIWHDHYGNSEFLGSRPRFALKILLRLCVGAIAVNTNLQTWIKDVLHFKNVIYLPNFAVVDEKQERETILQGKVGKRIVSLANLREQKNHFLLLDVAVKLKESHSDWSFHFVGKDFEDQLSRQIKTRIEKDKLKENVFLYGSCPDIQYVLNQASIGVLSSKSEGLPVALLEYGIASLAVVVTDVGEISTIINTNQNGMLVCSNNQEDFYEALLKLISDQEIRISMGVQLKETVKDNYSKERVLNSYLNWIEKC